MDYMNKKIIVASVLIFVFLTLFPTVSLGYNEPGPASAPVCNTEKPQKAWLYRIKSLGKGKYQLFWDKADRASSWTIGYGTQPGKYIYGLNDFGNDQSRDLIINTFSNKKFYFAIKANNGCMPGEWSNEWKVGTVGVGTAPVAIKTTKVVPVLKETPVKKDVVVKPVVSTSPVVVTKTPAARPTVVVTPPTSAPVSQGGFWGWMKGLFK